MLLFFVLFRFHRHFITEGAFVAGETAFVVDTVGINTAGMRVGRAFVNVNAEFTSWIDFPSGFTHNPKAPASRRNCVAEWAYILTIVTVEKGITVRAGGIDWTEVSSVFTLVSVKACWVILTDLMFVFFAEIDQLTPRHGDYETWVAVAGVRAYGIDTGTIGTNVWSNFTLIDVDACTLFGIAFLTTAFGNEGFESDIARFACESAVIIVTE